MSESTIVVVQLLSCVQLFATPWTAVHQASLSFSISQNLLIFMSIESMVLSNHLRMLLLKKTNKQTNKPKNLIGARAILKEISIQI